MNLENLRFARSLYYQCLGEVFSFSFSKDRLANFSKYLNAMSECAFDEALKTNFAFLLENLKTPQDIQKLIKEYDVLFLALKNAIPTTFSYIEEGFENSNALLAVRQILAKSKLRRNETFFKEGEDSVGFCFILMGEFLKEKNDDLAKELFEKLINPNIDEFLSLILTNDEALFFKKIAFISKAFMEFERFCFELEKPMKVQSKKVQNNLSRSEFLRRETNKQRRKLGKSQEIS
ncbi:molecular chaperone TorD family protein [Campylobacter helveticus]|uniref:Formate dehydrogenase-associated chaperone n=1 Tax=Campylobacter helveticus TaxID=28898 RepID=A0AAX2UH43_9BACT|nr:molecular chaperone TorD family protein [Campylobacter helveticus]ARE79809.1 formate dehydrogenase-associated chaperone [Campylobacter helveticus]MCR2038580.1 molecular chaperone TorD family protein [Campylobacter helveticus]MCR2054606.1 molecular chaperone TorD family protein [Campylobacter helveticus]MCR2056487.1 molecular chaperone TorD family protein [Campylobacter helveticus]MCR2061531.1 molecular chaperone TorD family protein [Campylobacter helveticus]